MSDRRYTTQVCHFAHHATAPACHRVNNGESSADHLFIKRGVQRLLGERKVRGRVETRDLGTGPGDAVDVYLPGSRRRLRFQLGAVGYRAWRRADDELAADADGIDWILASGARSPSTSSAATVTASGFAAKRQAVSDGSTSARRAAIAQCPGPRWRTAC
ncbi:hypothetical protein KYY02_23830 [Streptomyces pimonensis]|uniref:Uncharacterized protein n=1 Tax=Streptomyces pimonensis TaxID=2860288 RepID=A0ABV4J3V0_9ACTN